MLRYKTTRMNLGYGVKYRFQLVFEKMPKKCDLEFFIQMGVEIIAPSGAKPL